MSILGGAVLLDVGFDARGWAERMLGGVGRIERGGHLELARKLWDPGGWEAKVNVVVGRGKTENEGPRLKPHEEGRGEGVSEDRPAGGGREGSGRRRPGASVKEQREHGDSLTSGNLSQPSRVESCGSI